VALDIEIRNCDEMAEKSIVGVK